MPDRWRSALNGGGGGSTASDLSLTAAECMGRRAALRRVGRWAAAGVAFGGGFFGDVLPGGDWISGVGTAAAAEPLTVQVLEKGNSSLFQLRSARREVPVSRCPRGSQAKVRAVLDNVSIYRKLPEVRCEAEPAALEHFLDHPDVAVGLWRSMGVSGMSLTEIRPSVYDADAGDGSRGTVEVLYARPGERLIYCEGRFVNPVARKPIQANCVLDFRYRYEKSRSGVLFSRQSATMFVALPSPAVEATARVISPVSNRIADKNFEEVSLFVRMMSEAMRNKPGWCEQVGRGLVGVDDTKIDAFLSCCAKVHAAELRRVASAGGALRR